ncbi:phage terminase small subunit [Sphingomonas sp. PR090111-T3T-6A]|uniref:phage terminase small subunit n=1 Tax=Sphingomonas sp. PR090111-T3T-6A TaxID=685778 RepID=UPI00036C91CD|nr:phage terminase small subunit [Sphingomonas sp. PR090111-T3T-6A]
MTPGQRHRARVLAAKAAGGAIGPAPATHTGSAATEYALMKARLGNDLRRLHDTQSLEGKIAIKREILPEYADWVDGALKGMVASGQAVTDVILPHVMIWRIDVGDFMGAMPLAAAMLRFQLPLPERFDRTPATLICEEVADEANKALGQGGDFDVGVLQAVDHLVAGYDMPDQVRAKMNAAIGRALARQATSADDAADGPAGGKRAAIEAAIARLERALQLNPKVGVKKEIDALKREAKRLADAAKSEGQGA